MKTKIDAVANALVELRKETSTDSDFAVGCGLIQTGIEKLQGVQSRLVKSAADLKKTADEADAAAKAAREAADKAAAAEAAAQAAAQ